MLRLSLDHKIISNALLQQSDLMATNPDWNSTKDCTEWIKTGFRECINPNHALEITSFALGVTSIVIWTIAQLPQGIINFRKQDASALSILFLILWGIGDVLNLIACIFMDEFGTQIYAASFYIFTDLILILQYIYFGTKNKIKRKKYESTNSLNNIQSNNNIEDVRVFTITNNPIDINRQTSIKSANSSERLDDYDTNSESSDIPNNRIPYVSSSLRENTYLLEGTNFSPIGKRSSLQIHVTIPFILLFLFMYVFQFVNGQSTTNGDSIEQREMDPYTKWPLDDWKSIFGYTSACLSALFYIISRIPQIILNKRNNSTEGLSLIMFLLAIFGNLTYCASVLFYSVFPDFILSRLPWLIGSTIVLIFDCIIVFQFYYYRKTKLFLKLFDNTQA
ncbi:hypothetical protein ABK040_014387 [Willaertia magna]